MRNTKKYFYLTLFLVLFFYSNFFALKTSAATAEEICKQSGGSGLNWLGNCKDCPTGKHSSNGACVVDDNGMTGTPNDYDPNADTAGTIYGRPLIDNSGQKPVKFSYKLLESFPGFFTKGQVMTDLPAFISALYKFGVWTVGLAATFMLIIGGFMYMTSAGNNSRAGTAKGVITDALVGLVVALSAYLLLYVINPDLVTTNFRMTSVSVAEVPLMEIAVPTADQMSDSQARQALSQVGITVNKANCVSSTATNCTSLDGIPKKTIERVIAIKRACNCSFVVTGGTEAGHVSHGLGRPMIDISYSSGTANFLKNTKSNQQYATYGISQVCTSESEIKTISYNRSYSAGCKDPSSQPHFHLSFGL